MTATSVETTGVPSSNSVRPLVAVTMGDPAGIGPEVIVKTAARLGSGGPVRMVILGDAERLRDAARRCGLVLDVVVVDDVEDETPAGSLACLQVDRVPGDLPYGVIDAEAGRLAYEYIARAAELAVAGRVDAICTAPINKEALHAAGYRYPGHTELLAHLTGTDEVSMMLTTANLRVIHVTTHIGLLDAVARIEPGLVVRTVRRGDAALRAAGVERPRIAVCGINPHAGENGLFGYGEEEHKIAPAIETLLAEGVDVQGPLPADSAFFLAVRGDFDIVVAMYHDQGHGPIKVLGLTDGVNITVGLPVIRTSVDHGTAFDIAGTGVADEMSFIAALDSAADLANRRER
ncbi:4-hydroxythreonine-4-phosphate dehydrogenase PdxA [Nonomuraea sp. NPDC046570]|uniref:4-hydroxythreonine-4-phosphate dehydrogenase PdxA n=1 Tax=Nonomuraea sp. NPDC046570 TaxID=3155255 RepID=UPI0033E5196C